MPSHPLRNFETQNYFENGKEFNRDLSGKSLPKGKNKTYILNLNGYLPSGLIEFHCMDIKSKVLHFDSFAIKHIPLEI